MVTDRKTFVGPDLNFENKSIWASPTSEDMRHAGQQAGAAFARSRTRPPNHISCREREDGGQRHGTEAKQEHRRAQYSYCTLRVLVLVPHPMPP